MEPCIKRLLAAMLLGGVVGAIYKRKLKVARTEFYKRGNVKIATEWGLFEVWERNVEDANWIESNEPYFNGFIRICSALGLNPKVIRNFVKPQWEVSPEPRLVQTSKDPKELMRVKRSMDTQFNRKIDLAILADL
jgi:hypothetical protein